MRYEESGDGYSNIVQWGYDDENNLSSQTQTLNGSTYASTYAYDKDNRLTKATEGTISANYTYDSFSRMTGLTAKNGSTSVVNTAVTYVDPSSSATSTQVKTWNNGKAAYTYTYDNKGNITSITGGGQEFDYRYDRYGRLISAEDYPGGYVWTYTYDDGGNITQRGLTDYHNNKNPNSILATYTYGNADWPDLLTAFNGKSITYDAIGNPLSDGTWTYAWQHGRQLASMSKSGSSITYGYNADGKRISKTVNGTTYNFSYLGDQLTEMTWGSNKLHFTYDSTGPASVTYNGNRYFYLKNAQGDVTGLVDASGTQVVSYTYDPWGAPMSTDGTMAATLGAANPLRYRGYVYDSETGLYYLSSRYYNPTWGRFVNADTADVLGASPDKANWDKNLFAYCDNDPINRQDDEGDLWKWLPFKESGDWGFAHRMVQLDIIKMNAYRPLGREVPTNIGTRMDIYSYSTGEVWEIKPNSNGHGYIAANAALSAKYVGNYYIDNTPIVAGSKYAFAGRIEVYFNGYDLTIYYDTPMEGVVLYDFTLKKRQPQANASAAAAAGVAAATSSALIGLSKGAGGRIGGLGFGGGGIGILYMCTR